MALFGFAMNFVTARAGSVPQTSISMAWIISPMCILNGEHLGHHTGYFDPFDFDVTETLRSGKTFWPCGLRALMKSPDLDGWYLRKRLIKGVLNHHDCRPGGGWEPVGQSYNTGGIWNRVHLEQHGAVTIDHLLLRADMDTQPPTLLAELKVRNRSRKRSAQLEVRCISGEFQR